MYLIVVVALAMAFIIFATAKLNLHPFLTLSVIACGFGVLFGMQLLGVVLLSLLVL
jgi:gluconate:H+ symporter, GntP family